MLGRPGMSSRTGPYMMHGATRSGGALDVARAFAVYLVWCVTTWFLEKRVGLFARFDPLGRTLYAVVANIALGTMLAGSFVGRSERWRSSPVALVLTALLGGLAVVKMVPPGARDAVVLGNVFAQVLPTSIAEVTVCWLLVGGAVERWVLPRGKSIAVVAAIVVSDLVFALYHAAHSAPFDRPEMMAFLALPGLVVSLVVFVARDRILAMLVQNLFAVVGISKNLEASAFRHPFAWAYGVAALAALATLVALRASDRPETHR